MKNPPPPPSSHDLPPPATPAAKPRRLAKGEKPVHLGAGPPAMSNSRLDMGPAPEIDAPKVILKKHEPLPAPPYNAPRAPFVTNLELTREVEDMVNNRCTLALADMKDASGWTNTVDPEKFIYQGAQADPFRMDVIDRRHFEKRALFKAISENDMKWRRWLYGDKQIFNEHNLCANICRRISMAQAAKGISYFFGSRPYFTCYPRQKAAEGLAKSLQKVGESKMDKSLSSQALRDAIGESFNFGESVLKTTFERRMTLSKKKGRVMVTADGAFIFGDDGDYIIAGKGTADQVNTDLFQITEDGITVLKRDGVTVIPPGARFAQSLVARRTIHYQGPRIEKLLSRSFFCPLNAKTIQEADYCCHIYDLTPVQIASYFTDSQTAAELMQSVQVLQKIAGVQPYGSFDPASPSTAGTQNATLEVQEFYIRVDADQDGNTEDVCFVRVGPKGGEMVPIFYDYTENVTSTKQRPFHCVRPIPRDGRWTGIGAIELFLEYQKIIDLMLNRWSKSVSGSGFMTFFRAEAFEETSGDNPDLTLNDGNTYRLKEGHGPIENNVQRIYLTNSIGPEFKELMEFFLQLAVNESGVLTANDGNTAGLASSELATGLRQMDAAGNELYAVYVSSLEQGIESAINAFITTLYDKISTREAAIVMANNVPQEYEVFPRDVAGLDLEVSVVLAKFKSEHLIAALTAALGPAPLLAYYTSLATPEAKEGYGNALKQLLMAMNVESPEDIVLPMMLDPQAIPLIQQAFATLPPQIQQILSPAMIPGVIPVAPAGHPGAPAGPAPVQMPPAQPQLPTAA